MDKILFKEITKKALPNIKDRWYPIYFEYGKLNVDNYGLIFVDNEGEKTKIPVSMISTILLGPGTSVTHEAIKTASETKTSIQWVGEESLYYYANGKAPMATNKNLLQQIKLYSKYKLDVMKRMYEFRYPDENLSKVTLVNTLRGKEGHNVKNLYQTLSDKYGVGWDGRWSTDQIQSPDKINELITRMNQHLYSLCLSVVNSLGYSPFVGFFHSNSPIPFIYDIADLYKAEYTIEASFRWLSDNYDLDLTKENVFRLFVETAEEGKLIQKIPKDLQNMMKDFPR